MKNRRAYPEDSIVALATPWGESAVAMLRTSGRDSLTILSTLFKPTGNGLLTQARGHTMHYGSIREPAAGEFIDQVMVAVYRAPKSYTGEDGAEIFCHGSLAVIKRLVELLHQAGFRDAEPGEFTLRAFLNGKIDLTQAEAVNEIVRTKTDRARAVALSRLSGSIERRVNTIKQGIARLLAALEVRIDYPEDELALEEREAPEGGEGEPARLQEEKMGGKEESARLQEEKIGGEGEPVRLQEEKMGGKEDAARLQRSLEELLSTYGVGKILQEGVPVVLAGQTNAGKSTLFNQLLKEDRAIVSEIHGTTRDYLEGLVSMGEIPVRLYDTAGYRVTPGPLEREGLRRTDRIVENAQLILYLVDASRGLTAADRSFIQRLELGRRLICIWNKKDLAAAPCPEGFIPLNAREGEGLETLCQTINRRFLEGSRVPSEGPIINSLRQKELLERAAGALAEFRKALAAGVSLDLLAVDLKEALDALGQITGEITSQDILNEIFSHFCVGK